MRSRVLFHITKVQSRWPTRPRVLTLAASSALSLAAAIRLALGEVGAYRHDGRWVRMASRKEAIFAAELLRAGIRWEYRPRVGPVRVADFRLPDCGGALVEVWSGRGELRKSALPGCLIMSHETRKGVRRWIRKKLAISSTR